MQDLKKNCMPRNSGNGIDAVSVCQRTKHGEVLFALLLNRCQLWLAVCRRLNLTIKLVIKWKIWGKGHLTSHS